VPSVKTSAHATDELVFNVITTVPETVAPLAGDLMSTAYEDVEVGVGVALGCPAFALPPAAMPAIVVAKTTTAKITLVLFIIPPSLRSIRYVAPGDYQ